MLQAMYHICPVRIDIAGTVKSISEITPELLYDTYNKFYNAATLCISICGDIDPDETYEYINSKLDRIKPASDTKIITEIEDTSVYQKEIYQNLDVNIPIFNIGFKDNQTGLSGDDMIKKIVTGKITLDILFGKSSTFYNRLYNLGVINDTFDTEYVCEKEFSHSIISGESNDPNTVKEEVLNEIKVRINNIDEKDFIRQKIMNKSSHIRSFNSPENVASANLEGVFNNFSNYNFDKIIDEITIEDINKQLISMTEDLCVLSVVLPKE